MKNVTFFFLTFMFGVGECAKILVVFPMPGPSHYILGSALAKGLAEAGHEVTMVSPFGEKKPPKHGRYRDVVLTGMSDDENKPKVMHNLLDLENANPFIYIPLLNLLGNEMSEKTLKHPNFQKLLKSDEHFDAVIIEQFHNDALKVLAYHYKAPLIIFNIMGANAWISPLVGNPAPFSYIPNFVFGYSHDMTFWQRLNNWLFEVLSELNRQIFFFPSQNKMMHEYFPEAPDLSEMMYNISLVFLNSHESISQPVPHVPNMIDIGGFHVSPPKELPKDLKEFLDGATEGVIYFSMGSNIKPSQISEQQRQALLRAFSKIKQKVLWKWDEDAMDGKPDNVKLGKWFPQPDILAHPNTKAFITHGGLLSTTETVYHGVPLLAFPIFADQKMNAGRAVMDGYGLALKFSEITEEKISTALDKLLNDPKYRDNVKRRSSLLRDRVVKPMDLAVYWTEFVIRHRGAPHLRVAALDLPWYKYLLLDVVFSVILTIIGVMTLFYVIIRNICCKSSKTKEKVKRN